MEDRIYGPMLPQNLEQTDQIKEQNDKIVKDEYDDNIAFGPALPPHLLKNLKEKPYDNDNNSDDCVGDFIGPSATATTLKDIQLEKRALDIKIKNYNSTNVSQPKVREEWMTELPAIIKKSSLGLTARTFKTKDGPDFSDRSIWTKNPKDSGTDQKKKDEFKIVDDFQKERDREQEKIAKKLKKKHKREKSLLEMHQKKKTKEKKKKKERSEKAERRPFSRDTDLQANRFDRAKKNALIKKAQLLDTRFSSGKDAKYL